jgi:hypothetical protein
MIFKRAVNKSKLTPQAVMAYFNVSDRFVVLFKYVVLICPTLVTAIWIRRKDHRTRAQFYSKIDVKVFVCRLGDRNEAAAYPPVQRGTNYH